jgi:hypothetical protein
MIRLMPAFTIVFLVGPDLRSRGQDSPPQPAQAETTRAKSSPAEIEKLISQLGSPKFVERQASAVVIPALAT